MNYVDSTRRGMTMINKRNLKAILLVIALELSFFMTPQGMAQDLMPGKWTGIYSVDGEESPILVYYLVKRGKIDDNSPERYNITLYVHDAPFEFENLKFTKKKITFTMDPG